MSSIYKIDVPEFDVSSASTASYLNGNARTKNIVSTDGGNINFLNNISGSLLGTSSWATNAVSANTASWANNSIQSTTAITSSFLRYQPGSNTGTASFALSASNATTASYVSTVASSLPKAYINLTFNSGTNQYELGANYNIASWSTTVFAGAYYQYTINFTTPMASTRYCSVVNGVPYAMINSQTKTVSSYVFTFGNSSAGGYTNPLEINIVIY